MNVNRCTGEQEFKIGKIIGTAGIGATEKKDNLIHIQKTQEGNEVIKVLSTNIAMI